MSRIGKKPVEFPKGVTITVGTDNVVTVKGPKGELTQLVDRDIKIEVKDGLENSIGKQFVKRRLPEDSYKRGIITNPNQVGGYPEYKGKAYKDSDSDGISDAWEIKYGLNPKDASDANKDLNGDGYTNIEKYFNGIDPTQKIDWTKIENNTDTLAKLSKGLLQ